MIREQIFPGLENSIDWILTSQETPLSPTRNFNMDDAGVSKVEIHVGDAIVSSVGNTNLSFNGTRITASLGLALPTLAAGKYDGKLVLFSPDFPLGKLWFDQIEFRV